MTTPTRPVFLNIRTKEELDEHKLNSLEEWQNFVGGHMEVIMLKTSSALVVNENAKRENLEINHEASEEYGKYCSSPVVICGNAAVVSGDALRFL